MEAGLVHPAYDYILKCSHVFNLLDAKGAISVTERTAYISRMRNMARKWQKHFMKKGKTWFSNVKSERRKRI